MSKRRKKHDEEHISESWLIPYADILTLLLALFIVLFAASSVDAQKFQQLSQVFNGIFVGGTGPMDFQQPVPNDQPPTDKLDSSADENTNKQQKKLQKEDQEELQKIQAKINSYIEANQLKGKFSTKLTTEGLLLTIRDNVLFPSGSAQVRPTDKKAAREIAEMLEMDPPRNIIISGHTDNVPIRNAQFQSNWELSVMRAVNFMKVLLEDKNLDPRLFSAKGFGEFEPIASNETAEGREKNRRVEVLVLPRTAENEQK